MKITVITLQQKQNGKKMLGKHMRRSGKIIIFRALLLFYRKNEKKKFQKKE